ncbi:DUF523 domain-containing protein [Sinanaerobacter sp. ZZT-01]|uniref:DUF523 domain-containing protein n=1 Tax=Sinanaerobacter sp. ZZT-01 TaxID=3111540 RepID=UPI002D76CFD8|nr:DUF523 domain-containing protein [Sinanaerobacter sp. ZZT-01]WRR93695.1 DUF523 domain-containing protein [Sinanaerobacter sp. ZZT-01]
MYIVSACLLGHCCRYNGGSNEAPEVKEFLKNKDFIAVCPEVLGGLKTPRLPAEIVESKVINQAGEDVTEAFQNGAKLAYKAALKEAARLNEPIETAILKAKSPSCGSSVIYDGTFQGKLVLGSGFFTQLLKKKGIDVISEEDLKAMR